MRINLTKYKKNAIILEPDESVKNISKGGSKIGGNPDLPPDFNMNARECIGKYSGIKIDDNEKQKQSHYIKH